MEISILYQGGYSETFEILLQFMPKLLDQFIELVQRPGMKENKVKYQFLSYLVPRGSEMNCNMCTSVTCVVNKFYSILFYSILFYSILSYF